MKLDKQAKEDFDKWFQSKSETHYRLTEWFDNLDSSMQFGVIVDWADSVGIHINVIYECSEDDCYYYFDGVFLNEFDIGESMYKTRQEAREKAIEKLSKIYNKL